MWVTIRLRVPIQNTQHGSSGTQIYIHAILAHRLVQNVVICVGNLEHFMNILQALLLPRVPRTMYEKGEPPWSQVMSSSGPLTRHEDLFMFQE